MISILEMSLRKKIDLLGKEDLVGKKTTSKTFYAFTVDPKIYAQVRICSSAFTIDLKKKNRQFMISILEMSLRRKNDLLGKEDLVGKKTTSKTL
ncbi:hypothetical protein Tco_0517246 [Tanacetum coccineum]